MSPAQPRSPSQWARASSAVGALSMRGRRSAPMCPGVHGARPPRCRDGQAQHPGAGRLGGAGVEGEVPQAVVHDGVAQAGAAAALEPVGVAARRRRRRRRRPAPGRVLLAAVRARLAARCPSGGRRPRCRRPPAASATACDEAVDPLRRRQPRLAGPRRPRRRSRWSSSTWVAASTAMRCPRTSAMNGA